MANLITYIDSNALAIVLNTVIVIIGFLIARVAKVAPIPALVAGLLPILFFLALGIGGGGVGALTS